MSAPLRFLAIALIGWAGVRAATLGAIPGADMFSLSTEPAVAAQAPAVPAIVPTQFGPIDPPMAEAQIPPGQQQPPLSWPVYAAGPDPRYAQRPIIYYDSRVPAGAGYYPAALPAPRRVPLTPIVPTPAPLFYSPIPQLDDWPLSHIASASIPARRSATAAQQQSLPQALDQQRLDRLQLTAWALLRGQPGPSSLATAGTLGGSQAGARLTYNVSRELAATFRTTSGASGSRGGEFAVGVRVTPFRSIPLSITAERRQAIGRYGGGRSAFALFAEGGLYQRPMPWRLTLDAYAQAGVVGLRSRDYFADGGLTLTRPVYKQFSAGVGVWGGVQPGIYRVDAGPRVSMSVRKNMRVHFDWRQRVAGNAAPGSGPAVTLAGDF